MSSPYPPQAPKRLERSKSNRVLGGVCAGVANYLNMDPTLVRVLTVVISLFTGVPIVLYIIALFVVPEEGSQPNPPSYPPVGGPQGQTTGFSGAPTGQSAYAPPATSRPAQPSQAAGPVSAEDSVWGSEGAPWEQRQSEPAAAQPQSVSDSEPVGPSEPEAPVAPPAHEEDATEWAAEPEGPEARAAGTESSQAEGATTDTEPGDESEGGQQTDRS
ncbi:MAG TPA: PspC domain-containing protein [Propionibacteriaceae bacterium]|jgi:phage shock protein PspC (stress-responsive transcriptional regulator)